MQATVLIGYTFFPCNLAKSQKEYSFYLFSIKPLLIVGITSNYQIEMELLKPWSKIKLMLWQLTMIGKQIAYFGQM